MRAARDATTTTVTEEGKKKRILRLWYGHGERKRHPLTQRHARARQKRSGTQPRQGSSAFFGEKKRHFRKVQKKRDPYGYKRATGPTHLRRYSFYDGASDARLDFAAICDTLEAGAFDRAQQ